MSSQYPAILGDGNAAMFALRPVPNRVDGIDQRLVTGADDASARVDNSQLVPRIHDLNHRVVGLLGSQHRIHVEQ